MRFSRAISIVDVHAEGEVGNVIVGGVVGIPGATTFEKMQYLRDHADGLRRSILFEPRGSVCQAANLLLPATHPDADLAFVIMEATKYPAMSGSNAMCVATVVLETGIRPMIEPETRLVLEAPGGLVEARCLCRAGKVERVSLTMLPAFVYASVASVEVPGWGPLDVDVAYGGIFHGIVRATSIGFEPTAARAADLVRVGIAIRSAVNRAVDAVHPLEPSIRGVANIVIAGEVTAAEDGCKSTVSATVIGNGRLDRSPTGTGVAARMALLHREGTVAMGEDVMHRSIFGTAFRSTLIEPCEVGPHPAVVADVAGQAWITGFRQVLADPTDPFAQGHCPGDVWLNAG